MAVSIQIAKLKTLPIPMESHFAKFNAHQNYPPYSSVWTLITDLAMFKIINDVAVWEYLIFIFATLTSILMFCSLLRVLREVKLKDQRQRLKWNGLQKKERWVLPPLLDDHWLEGGNGEGGNYYCVILYSGKFWGSISRIGDLYHFMDLIFTDTCNCAHYKLYNRAY